MPSDTPDLLNWIPRRAMLASGLRAEANLEDPPAEAPEPAEEAGSEPAEPEKPEWESRLDALLEDDDETGEGEANAEAEQEAGEPAAAEAVEAGAGEEGLEEEAAEETDEEAGTDAGAPTSLHFPGRRTDDDDYEVQLTPEIRDALEAQGVEVDDFVERAGQLRNEGLRRQEYEDAMFEVQGHVQELDNIESQLRDRPADFLADRVRPELHAEVAKKLLLRLPDETFGEIFNEVLDWDRDPSTRRLAAADEREASVNRRDEAAQSRTQRTEQQNAGRELARTIAGLVPETMEDAKADEFFDFATYKLEQWVRKQPKGSRIDPEQVPALLAELGALTPYGLSPDGEAHPTEHQDAPSESARRTRPADPELADRARQTGKDLKARHDRRKDAAVAPAGAGSSHASVRPPKGQTFAERLKWVSDNFGT